MRQEGKMLRRKNEESKSHAEGLRALRQFKLMVRSESHAEGLRALRN
jgi:hypothetical protein